MSRLLLVRIVLGFHWESVRFVSLHMRGIRARVPSCARGSAGIGIPLEDLCRAVAGFRGACAHDCVLLWSRRVKSACMRETRPGS